MNWVSSSLELAGSLLESVDQQAALTLAGEEEEDGEEEESMRPTLRVSQPSADNASSTVETGNGNGSEMDERSKMMGSASSSSDTTTNAESHTDMAPLELTSGRKLTRVGGTVSTHVEHVSSRRGGDAPLSDSSMHSSTMDVESDRLYKELERLKKELRVKEKQLSSMQKGMQICENELVALEEECKEKISQVQHELSVVQQDKNLNEEEFVRALEMKDNQVRAMKADIDALSEANAQRTGEIASLKAELVNVVESKDTLWTSAASASNESEQLIQSLRSELQDTLAAMKILKREHTKSKNAMYSRQSQLESVNTELMNNVASLERELAKARTAASAGSQTRFTDNTSVTTVSSSAPFGANAINDDYRRVQGTLIVTKKLLHDKSRTNEVQQQEIVALNDEVHRLKQVIATAEEHSTRQLDAVSIENEKLRERVERLASQTNAATAASDEQRIQRLTNKLIEKQETIDSLRSRVTTMDVRLRDMQLQAQQAKEQLVQVVQHGGIDDIEMATSVGKTDRNGMRSRPNRMANMISRVVPVVERSYRVLTVLDVLDRWLLFLGRVFLQAPFARLGMLCYIVLIHLWVFTIISFHTSHLTEETQLASATENAIFEPGKDLILGAGH